MAAHTVQSTRSRRYIKIYLGTWGLLAVGALGYLAMLTFRPQAAAPTPAAVETAQADAGDSKSGDPQAREPSPGDPGADPDPRSGSNPLADGQGSQSEIRKDVAQPKDAASEPAPDERTAKTGPSASEKPAQRNAIGIPQPTAVPGVTIAGGAAGTGVADSMAVRADAPDGTRLPDDSARVQAATPPASSSPSASPPFVPIETGSITPQTESATAEVETVTPKIVKVTPVKKVDPVKVDPVKVTPESVSVASETASVAPKKMAVAPDTKVAPRTVSVGPDTRPEPKSTNVTPESEPATKTASLSPETASVAPSEDIVFGEPVVTRARRQFAVQLGASPSLKALRRSWGEMAEQHVALGSLQPRVLVPGPDSGVYRLLAGPVPSKAEAERICVELGVGPTGCFATNYGGAPL